MKDIYPVGLNKINKIKVLELIRSSRTISRAKIVKITKLSAPTVSRIVDNLINNEKLVADVGIGNSGGGRPPNLVKFNGADKFIIGIQLEQKNIRGIFADLNAKIISEITIPNFAKIGFDKIMERTSDIINDLIKSSGVDKNKILGIGISIAGLINKKNKIVEFSPDFNWQHVDVLAALRKKFDVPIIIDNEMRVIAIGELSLGVGEKYNDFICVGIGHGIGAGIVIDGKPFYGSHGIAGEFGHTVIEKNSSVKCICGNFGCLEAYASERGIVHAAKIAMENNEKTILSEMCDNNPELLTFEMVADAAKSKDKIAKNIFLEASKYIALGISNLIRIFDPEAVIIGGGVSMPEKLLLQSIKKNVNKRAITSISKEVHIDHATFGAKAAVMGTVALIIHEVLNFNLPIVKK